MIVFSLYKVVPILSGTPYSGYLPYSSKKFWIKVKHVIEILKNFTFFEEFLAGGEIFGST